MKRVLILGLGNVLMGDDGVGVRVIDRLQNSDQAEVVNGATAGLSLLEMMKGHAKTVVVDAVDMGKAPGTVAKFSADDLLKLPASRHFSLHEMGLAEALRLGRSLNEEFKNVTIIGVQPKNFEGWEKLSPEVEAVIPEVIELVKKEVV